MMFLTIWKKNFFFAKSHMGTLLEWFFFTQKKSVSISGIFGHTNQKCFQYDQRPSYIILWKEGNFCKSNSYGHTMVLSSIYRDFFIFLRMDWKLIEIGYTRFSAVSETLLGLFLKIKQNKIGLVLKSVS